MIKQKSFNLNAISLICNAELAKILRYAIIAAGIIFALIQFFSNRSLWNDEGALAACIINTPYSSLFQEFENYQQSAPVGFLFVVKAVSGLVPMEYGLRLFPLLCWIASIFVFAKLTKIFIRNSFAQNVALAFYCLCPGLIYYSSECKQYMCDVFFAVMLTWLAFRPNCDWIRRNILLAIAGVSAILFSNASLFVLAVCGLRLFYESLARDNSGRISSRRIALVFVTGGVWALTFAAYYLLIIQNQPQTREYMHTFWFSENAMPFDARLPMFVARHFVMFSYAAAGFVRPEETPFILCAALLVLFWAMTAAGTIQCLRNKKLIFSTTMRSPSNKVLFIEYCSTKMGSTKNARMEKSTSSIVSR